MRAIAALMRRRGLKVQAMAGWEQRGRSATFHPRAVLLHHTAAAVDVDRILRDGRSDLPGPLCNWALHADGTWVLVAAGRANHAGTGTLPSGESYGIEATGPNHPGKSGPAAFDNYAAYVLGVTCILEAEGWDTGAVFGHKETARPLGRKVDPAFPVAAFATDVRRATLPQGEQEDLDMTKEELVQTLRDALSPGFKTVSEWADQLNQVKRDVAQIKTDVAALKGQAPAGGNPSGKLP